jgi:hypothetical protein
VWDEFSPFLFLYLAWENERPHGCLVLAVHAAVVRDVRAESVCSTERY